MKKYFMLESGNEIHFGDMIELDLTKDLPNGKIKHIHFDCKFIPELVPLLLENEVIKEEEIEEEELDRDALLDFGGIFGGLTSDKEDFMEKLNKIEAEIMSLKTLITKLLPKHTNKEKTSDSAQKTN